MEREAGLFEIKQLTLLHHAWTPLIASIYVHFHLPKSDSVFDVYCVFSDSGRPILHQQSGMDTSHEKSYIRTRTYNGTEERET